MIVSQQELELILNPRIRQRTFLLPVRRGKWGELKRCPARKGGVYTLRGAPSREELQRKRADYRRYRAEVHHLPSQRAGALWLFDCCEVPLSRSLRITVRSVQLSDDGSAWVIGFTKGDQGEVYDKPRLLAANPGGVEGDYTTAASMAVPGSAEEIPEAGQHRYVKASDNARRTGLNEQRQRMLDVVGALRLEAARLNAGNAISRRRLKSVEHQLRAYDREMRRSA